MRYYGQHAHTHKVYDDIPKAMHAELQERQKVFRHSEAVKQQILK